MSYLSTAPASGAGSGTVTQVNSGTGLTGGPVTTTGTLSLETALQPMATLTGNSLKVLRVNAGGTAVEYAAVGSPGGGTNAIQYNNAGVFAGSSNLSWDETNTRLSVGVSSANSLDTVSIYSAAGAHLGLQYDPVSFRNIRGRFVHGGNAAGMLGLGGLQIAAQGANQSTLGSGQIHFLTPTGNSAGSSTDATLALRLTITQAGSLWNSQSLLFGNTSAAPYAYITATSNGVSIENSSGGTTNGRTIFLVNANERARMDANGLWGFMTNSPTHTLTLASTTTGLALYNTADQTTNYERARLYWSSNTLTLSTELGGTGSARGMQFIVVGSGSNGVLSLTRASLPTMQWSWGSNASTSGTYVNFTGTNSGTSGTISVLSITPTYNQAAATTANTDFLINRTETAVGSGTQLMIDAQVGGVSKFSVDNTGKITSAVNTIQLSSASIVRSGAHALTLSTSGTTNATYPSGTITLVDLAATQTLTNKRVTKRVGTTTSSATPTINTDTVDYYELTAQAVDITSFTTNLSGTPTNGQNLWISITGTAARAITWGASFEASTVALPTTTVSTNRLDVGFVWNAATSKWRCVASG